MHEHPLPSLTVQLAVRKVANRFKSCAGFSYGSLCIVIHYTALSAELNPKGFALRQMTPLFHVTVSFYSELAIRDSMEKQANATAGEIRKYLSCA